MKIALDYDNTFTRDPDMWGAFIQYARARGHEVKIVSSRHPQAAIPLSGIEIVYCSFKAKRAHYPADVWIDDDPAYIDKDHGA